MTFDIDNNLDVDVDVGVGVETRSEVSSEPRWLVLFGGVVAAAVVVALVIFQNDVPTDDRAGPPPGAVAEAIPPVAAAVEEPPTPIDGDLVEGDLVEGYLVKGGPVEGDGERETVSGFGQLELLTEIGELASSFSLVEFSPRPNNNQLVRVVELQGTTRELPNDVYFQATAWPAWPGDPLRPFESVASNIVFSSRGEIVVASLVDDSNVSVGSGTSVIDGNGTDDFWAVEAGGRSVSRYWLGAKPTSQEFSFVDVGRPLAAVGDGLVVVPDKEQGIDGLALWMPATALKPLPIPPGFSLLGTSESRIVTGDGTSLRIHEPLTDLTVEVALVAPVDMERASLSPDGLRLALAQDHEVTSLGEVIIVDVETGAVISVIDEVVDQDVTWTSADTLVMVDYEAPSYRVVEYEVTSGRRTPVATITYPWVYLAAVS